MSETFKGYADIEPAVTDFFGGMNADTDLNLDDRLALTEKFAASTEKARQLRVRSENDRFGLLDQSLRRDQSLLRAKEAHRRVRREDAARDASRELAPQIVGIVNDPDMPLADKRTAIAGASLPFAPHMPYDPAIAAMVNSAQAYLSGATADVRLKEAKDYRNEQSTARAKTEARYAEAETNRQERDMRRDEAEAYGDMTKARTAQTKEIMDVGSKVIDGLNETPSMDDTEGRVNQAAAQKAILHLGSLGASPKLLDAMHASAEARDYSGLTQLYTSFLTRATTSPGGRAPRPGGSPAPSALFD